MAVAPSKDQLWPANHKMVAITLNANVSDAADAAPTTHSVSVSSNEATNGTGDGDSTPDWQITGEMTLHLRAERAESGNGRVYMITIESEDHSGNTTAATTTVSVPHNQ